MIKKLNFRKEEIIVLNLDDKLIIKKPSNNNLVPLIIFGVFSLLILNSFFLFLNNENSIATSIVLTIGVFSLRNFLWNLKGFEIVEIDKNYLYIKRKGSFLFFNKKYKLSKIKDVKYKSESKASDSIINYKINELFSMYTNLIGMNGGDIIFKYDNLAVTFFENLTHNEKEKIVTEIKIRL